MTKKFGLWILNLSIKAIILVAAIYFIIYASKYAFKTGYELMAKTPAADTKIVTLDVNIPKGASTATIANILKEKGLINSTLYFRIQAKLSGNDGLFQFGDYTLNTGMDEEEIMSILLTEGQKRETITFTIPEGYTVEQIADKLSSDGIVKRQEFLDVVYNADFGYDFIKDIPDRNLKLQGYLFPNTYEVYADASAEDIVSTMLKEFDKEFKSEYYDRVNELGMTVDEIITVASIIEREVRVDSERERVAGVIYNRLENGMNLEMCSTVMYALGKTKERLLLDDLDVDSPYNTYRNAGLPIGPISNPGLQSILAALYPENNDYLFFVLKDEETGEHEFNKTLEEHNAAKNRYLQKF